MSTVVEIQDAIQKLSPKEKSALTVWLESQETPVMSASEEAALLARLDKAAQELEAGKSINIEEARNMVGKWATR